MQNNEQLKYNETEEYLKLIPENVPNEINEALLKLSRIQESVSIDDLQQHAEQLLSTDIVELYTGLTTFRRYISDNTPSRQDEKSNQELIQDVLDCQASRKIFSIIGSNCIALLQYDAAWILANITSGSTKQILFIFENDGINLIKILLVHPYQLLIDFGLIMVANIAADCIEYRDQLLEAGILVLIEKLIALQDSKETKIYKQGVWAFANLCCGQPRPQEQFICNSFDTLANVIKSSDNEEILRDALIALLNICESPEKKFFGKIVKIGITQKLIKLLEHKSVLILAPSLRILGKIACGNDECVDNLIQNNILSQLGKLLHHSNKKAVVEAMWVISNIAAESSSSVTLIIKNQEIISRIFELATNSEENSIIQEAILVILNALQCAEDEDIEYFVSIGVFQILVKLLDQEYPKFLVLVLEAINIILESGEDIKTSNDNQNPYLQILENGNGLDKIEKLQMHSDFNVYKKTLNILESFYGI